MNLWTWRGLGGKSRLGVSPGPDPADVRDVSQVHPDLTSIEDLWDRYGSVQAVRTAVEAWLTQKDWQCVRDSVSFQVPVPIVECWAAGVTYAQSRDARIEETHGAQTFYEQVYTASRPELFFKAPGARVRGPGAVMGLRRDATWHVPEPELTVILAPGGEIFGFTVGNDLSSRDIEGENPLYLPQAKIFHGSAALGPSIAVAGTVDPRDLTIELTIYRHCQSVFHGAIHTATMRRTVEELVHYLCREWPITGWTALMTGTSLVPPSTMHLEDGDEVVIAISGIGTLRNTMRRIGPDWVSVKEY